MIKRFSDYARTPATQVFWEHQWVYFLWPTIRLRKNF